MSSAPLPFTLRQLQYAIAVAETSSFRKAAERCRVAQPSLSAQIAELERSLGSQLFERDQRRVLVTPAGVELVERARRVLAAAGDLEGSARRHADPLSGTLRIGVIPTVAPYLLPDAVPALRKAFPKLFVAWSEEKTADLVPKVAAGDLDAALLARDAMTEGLESIEIGEDPFVLATPLHHALAKGGAGVTTEDLAGQRVLLLEDGHCLRDQALEVCATAHAEELGFRATSLPTLVQMIAGAEAVTLLPRIAVATESRHAPMRIRTFEAPAPSRTLLLAWRRRSPLGAALTRVGATLVKAFVRASESTRA
jgi:LysR family hydrogen peroxide-inducible transcriptional activator